MPLKATVCIVASLRSRAELEEMAGNRSHSGQTPSISQRPLRVDCNDPETKLSVGFLA